MPSEQQLQSQVLEETGQNTTSSSETSKSDSSQPLNPDESHLTEAERKLGKELRADQGVKRIGRLSGVFSIFKGLTREEKWAEADSAASHHALWGTGGEVAPTCAEDEMQNILTGGDLKIEVHHHHPEPVPPTPAPTPAPLPAPEPQIMRAQAVQPPPPQPAPLPAEPAKPSVAGTVLTTAAKAAGFGLPVGIALAAIPAISGYFNGDESEVKPPPPAATAPDIKPDTSSTTIINRGGVPPEFSLEPDKEVEK
jgi:hypothetical protein